MKSTPKHAHAVWQSSVNSVQKFLKRNMRVFIWRSQSEASLLDIRKNFMECIFVCGKVGFFSQPDYDPSFIVFRSAFNVFLFTWRLFQQFDRLGFLSLIHIFRFCRRASGSFKIDADITWLLVRSSN